MGYHRFQIGCVFDEYEILILQLLYKIVYMNFRIKELSFCHKLYFSNLYIFATQCRRPVIFQTMNSVRPNNLSLKYQRFTSSDFKDIDNLSL